MELSDHERRQLLVAFHKLTSGDPVGFDYALWVGFGDGWKEFRNQLSERGYISLNGAYGRARANQRTKEFLDALRRAGGGEQNRA